MDRSQIAAIASVVSSRQGVAVSEAEIALALVSVDVDELRAELQLRVSWDRWDKASPINGIDAAYFLQRSDYAGGEVYTVSVDERVIVVQPHVPHTTGIEPIFEAQVEQFAEEQCALIIEEMLLSTLIDTVEAQLQLSQTSQASIADSVLPSKLRTRR